jgi:TM2 domain-containing membrane protein YozV
MSLNIKAAVLSAFVLPGLGQVVNGKKLKGFVLISIVNIYILIALAFVLKGMGSLLASVKAGGTVDAVTALEQFRQNSGGTPRLLLISFLGIWIYAVIDALVDRPKDDDAVKRPGESD